MTTIPLKISCCRTEADPGAQRGEFCVDSGRNHKAGRPGLQGKGLRSIEGILSCPSLPPLPLVTLPFMPEMPP